MYGVLGQLGTREGAFFYGGGASDGVFVGSDAPRIVPAAPDTALPSPARLNPYVWLAGGRAFIWTTDDQNPRPPAIHERASQVREVLHGPELRCPECAA